MAQERPVVDGQIAVPAELDVVSSEHFVASLVRARGADLELDCSSVTFIDSSGLRTLLEANEMWQSDGRRFTLLAPSAPVRRLLQLTELETVFTICD